MHARCFLLAIGFGYVLLATTCAAEIPIERTRQPHTKGAVTLIYDMNRGKLSIDFGGTLCRTIEITSKRGLFQGKLPKKLANSPFNVWTPRKLFILQKEGIGMQHLGPALPPGETFDSLRKDLAVKGERFERVYLLIVGIPLA